MSVQHVRRETRKADLSIPYSEGDQWCVDETLYPESRGYEQHKFPSQLDAEKFIEGAK